MLSGYNVKPRLVPYFIYIRQQFSPSHVHMPIVKNVMVHNVNIMYSSNSGFAKKSMITTFCKIFVPIHKN